MVENSGPKMGYKGDCVNIHGEQQSSRKSNSQKMVENSGPKKSKCVFLKEDTTPVWVQTYAQCHFRSRDPEGSILLI